MADGTEPTRWVMTAEINSNPGEREALEERYGADNVWSTSELGEAFVMNDFTEELAPYAMVTRRSDNVEGTVIFQNHPRLYFSFKKV